MGKGYNNYMCKKPFHPGSKANIKRTWMAEQRTENEKKKQEELRQQYEKEQDLYNNRALISKESKEKLALNFMYEAPPGAKRERQKEDDEPEYKFEWQRKYNAPREDFAKDNAEIRDQPFGIPVRNVRCIKCHKWGHINTDKECPLFNKASTSSLPTTQIDPLELMKQMRDEGYSLKQNILGHQMDPSQSNQQMLESGDEEDPEVAFLRTLSTKQKKKLLRKLNKLAEKNEQGKKRKKSKKKKSHKNSYDCSDSDISCKAKKKKKSKKKSHHYMSSCSSDTEDEAKSFSSSNFDVAPKKRKHKNDHKEETNKRHKFQNGH